MKRILTVTTALFLGAAAVLAQEKAEYRAYLVSNAHFDSQWNWDVQRSISEYIPKTMDRNLFLLEKYPDYIFNFEGGIKYSWMKEYFPEKYDLVKKYIRQGRWHVTGSTWERRTPISLPRNPLQGTSSMASTSTGRSSEWRGRTSSFLTASVSDGPFRP